MSNPNQPSEETSHWYCLSFSGPAMNGEPCQASTYMGFCRPGISMPRILKAKQWAGVRSDAVLVACSYLGEMSKTDFETMT